MNPHVCGPWADCDAACMERSYREYEAQEAERCEHGVLPEVWCEDCYDASGGYRGHPGSRCSIWCGFCGRCG